MRTKVIAAGVQLAVAGWSGHAVAAARGDAIDLKLATELSAPRNVRSVAFDSAPRVRAASVDRASLLSQARLWESRNRDDLAVEALSKLLRVLPDDADALAELALIHARNNRQKEAQATLEQLRRVRPEHDAFGKVEALERLSEVDRDKLRQIRMLAKARRIEEALAAMRALFPKGAPTPDLELEYWQLVGDSEHGWDAAYAGMVALVRAYPDNPRYRLALTDHVLARKPDNAGGLKVLAEMTQSPQYEKQARNIWRRSMLRLPPVASSIPLIEAYLAQEKSEDAAVAEQLALVRRTVETQRRLLADPHYRAQLDGLALLEQGKNEQAEARILEALKGRPRDPDLLGGLGTLRMRQGHHAEARAYFLLAQREEPAVQKWANLARTAEYWGLLREAGDAADAGEFALGESKLREALALDPREPAAFVALGRSYAAQKRVADAEKAYRAALSRNKNEFPALRALAMLYVENGREAEAQQTLAQLSAKQKQEIGDDILSLRAAMLQTKAEELLTRGRTDAAVLLLDRAVKYDPDDPWLRYNLARLYATLGRPERGQALFDELLAIAPDDAGARYAYALYQSNRGQDGEALLTLEKIASGARTAGMTGLQRRLWVGAVTQSAARLAANGQPGAARALLERAAGAIGDDADLAIEIASGMADAGDRDAARMLLQKHASAIAPSADLGLRAARVWGKLGDDALLAGELTRLGARDLNAAQRAVLADLGKNALLRRAAALRTAGKPRDALALLQEAGQAADADVRALEARVLGDLGWHDEAVAAYKQLLRLRPDDRSAEAALIELLAASGRRGEALARVDAAAGKAALDADFSADLVSALLGMQDLERAARLNAAALAHAPDHARSLLYGGRLADLRGDSALAARLLQRGLAQESALRDVDGSTPLSLVRHVDAGRGAGRLALDAAAVTPAQIEAAGSGQYRRVAELLDRNATWIEGAVDTKQRSGSGGKSALRAVEAPLEFRTPLDGRTRVFVRGDVVRYKAGALDVTDNFQVRTFGSMLLCETGCAGPYEQHASGLALSAGVEREDLRADIGTTPLGFPVRGIVGGITKTGGLGPLSYSAEASRRAVAGSVLSYAGVTDPRTGTTWGGVKQTGVRLGLSLDQGGLLGGWTSLGSYSLTGKNVQSNHRTQWMGGLTLRIVNRDDLLVSAGLTGMVWKHRVNAGEYTLGHGGYYSPASYKSLSLPLTVAQRFGRWSYAVRAAVSKSRSRTDEAAYFPLNADMQARADALGAANFFTARYGAGESGARGTALSAAAEYQLSPQLFVGARLERDRSPDYAPNRALLYFRYAAGRASARSVDLLPQAVYPSSQN